MDTTFMNLENSKESMPHIFKLKSQVSWIYN